ncbi:MAG TPA: hypothetical protein VMW72_05885 [Sedimentisphaerales bacterium]|nr:hypothetical protein [Sedimentisphaerales bacterium]
MPSPKNNPKILGEWFKTFSEAQAAGTPKSCVYRSIARSYQVSFSTVKYYLDPHYKELHKRRERQRYREFAKRRRDIRRYNRYYRRLTRNPETFLSSMFNFAEQVSLEDITAVATELAKGIQFRSSTIERLLSRYIRNKQGPPFLEQTKDGAYHICKIYTKDADKQPLIDDAF